MKYLLLLLLLTGCGTPHSISLPIETKVEVPIKCRITKPDLPLTPFSSSAPGETIFDKLKKAIAEIEFREAYETELNVAVDKCLE